MKKILSIASALLLIQVSTASAIVGGPWDNDNYAEGREAGIYQAVATMRNGMGIMRFGNNPNTVNLNIQNDDGTTELNAANQSVWWYQGVTYAGDTWAIVDMRAKSVVGINTADSRDPTALNAPINTPAGQATPTNRGNRRFLTANWHATIRTQTPQVRFDGSGTVAVFGELENVSSTLIQNITTPDVTGPGGTIIVTATNTRTVNGFGGESDEFPQVGKQLKIRVFGSRTSLIPPGAN